MKVTIRKKKLSNGDHSLYLDVYKHGKRKYEFLNLRLTKDKLLNKETLQLAESIKAKRIIELQNNEHGFISHHKKKANFVDYFQKLKDERPADRSSWYSTNEKLKTYTNGYIQFADIDEEWVKAFQSFLLSEVSQHTAFHYYSNIKYAFNRAVKEKIISSNPCALVDNIQKPDVQRVYLELDEIKKLASTPCSNPEIKRAFLFSCFTGLRISDVYALTWGNIKSDVIEYRQKKTTRMEYLPLSGTAQELLKQQKPENILPMPDIKVFRLPTKSPMLQTIKTWVKKAKIDKNVSFHTARHTFATLSLTQGADIYTVSKLLGHKDISTTQKYARIVDEVKRLAVDNLPLIEIK
ncbi:MAG: site-specific integrase [Bacteroidetes bacterium]|nr:site-specific integrase [Bacteroidota bacterium]